VLTITNPLRVSGKLTSFPCLECGSLLPLWSGQLAGRAALTSLDQASKLAD